MSSESRLLEELVAAIDDGAHPSELGAIPLPSRFRAAVLRREQVEPMMRLPEGERHPSMTVHLEQVTRPVLAPDEVLVAVMASAINFNTVWSATFAPVPTFAFLDRLAAQGGWEQRHGGDRHIIGSDAAGVVVAAGELVRRWDVGDHVTVHGNWVLGEDPGLYRDAMRSPTQRAWGFETNFGGLADFAVVKANQLLTKAPHLTWAEAASSTLCNATAYRMLISPNGAQLRLGDRVLIWGATGGIGSFAVQLAMAAGAEPICVVSRPERVRLLKALGVRHVIDRSAAGFTFTDGRSSGVDHAEVARFRGCVRDMAGDGVDVVFEHPGRETMPASIAACRRGGTVVTCAATTGYGIPWGTGPNALDEVRVIGSHFANYWENDQANELLHRGLVHPTLTCTYPLGEVAEATELVRSGSHDGKVGIDCLGKPGSGITDAVLRARLGEQEVETFARLAQASRVVDRE